MTTKTDKDKYPLLLQGRLSGVIVNMTAHGEGTVVGTGHGNHYRGTLGTHSRGWAMRNFKVFVGDKV